MVLLCRRAILLLRILCLTLGIIWATVRDFFLQATESYEWYFCCSYSSLCLKVVPQRFLVWKITNGKCIVLPLLWIPFVPADRTFCTLTHWYQVNRCGIGLFLCSISRSQKPRLREKVSSHSCWCENPEIVNKTGIIAYSEKKVKF